MWPFPSSPKAPDLRSEVLMSSWAKKKYLHRRSQYFTRSYANWKAEKQLPWLAASTGRGQGRVGKNEISKGARSSWEESAEKFLKGGASTVEIRETHKFGSRGDEFRNKDNIRSEDEQEEEEVEVVNDPRWYKIRNRFDNFVEAKPGAERAEVRRWNKQESWGRKTWKEAKESTVPKIIGEGIYGVGPVLAALSAGRREFYALYVQEGLDLTVNNKKKKDKKGFEKVLKMAEKIGLSKKEVSKHDLNMVADNRPHQGLVLDASPLEMVGIKELEPVSVEGEKGPLWLALDEVTDPQNLGAIIRSAYFFGASGVVLCAKNSAPLSGVVSKASAGSLELMELRSCKNMMQFLASSAGNGWRVLGGSVSPRAVPLSEVVPGAPTILVLGSEGTGLRPLVERACTELIRIPGNFPVNFVTTGDEDVDTAENAGQEFKSFLAVESLNVSVAAGVLLNHLIGSNYSDSGRIEENLTGVIE
ncbi:UNVERIFIED_CONTAM: rRNA methyltransferase 1, mitochondrial [Sesamum latifolium]|uniref:rRNA methyltransferase 1, mitochondrial n=1 Tax=Sesamum latifolium TaxID=2727402 RepID=A0AAW2VCR9_9LAMI